MLKRLLRPRFTETMPRNVLGRRMVAILLPLVLIPLIIMGTAAYIQARNLLRAQIEDGMSSRINEKLFDLSTYLTARTDRLHSDSNNSVLLDSVDALFLAPKDGQLFRTRQRELRDLMISLRVDQEPVIFNYMLVVQTSSGEILASSNEEWEGETLEPEIMQELLLGEATTYPTFNHPLLSPHSLSILTHTPVFVQSSGMDAAILIGITSGLMLEEAFEDIQRVWIPNPSENVEGMRVFLALNPGTLIEIQPQYFPTFRLELQEQGTIDHPAFRDPTSATMQTLEYDDIFGNPVIGTFSWLPTARMGIITELPESVFLSEINALAPLSIILVVAAALFTIIIVLYTSHRLLQPLTELTEFSQRMARGDWQHRVPEGREDEVGFLSRALNTMAEEVSRSYRSLEDRVTERTRQIRTASQVARVVISAPSLEDLLRRAVELIKTQFGYYHVSIFLLDEEEETAQIAESTGEIGQALKARGHGLKVGSQSIIGWVTANNQARIAYDVAQDPLHLANELLPETRSEAAVPLQVAGRVLGALDVQSTEPEAFSPQDVEILQTLADQLCAAIQNARLAATSITAADRARLMSEITQELSRQMTVEDVMQTTARMLHRALGRPEIVVRLHAPEQETSLYPE